MGGTANNIQAWGTTEAANATADSTIASSNGESPTSIDNDIRNVMTAIAKYADDTGGALVAGGSSTALTVTTGQSLLSAHIANGLRLCVRTASAATGPATIAIDGLTAVDIKSNSGNAIASGDWTSGAILDLVYSQTASAFIAANVGGVSGISISSLTEDTAPAHAADYIPTYDTSAGGNRKALPKNLFPAAQASFSAHKNGASQVISNSVVTKIAFGTEIFDTGSLYDAVNSKWVPPAGKVLISAAITFDATFGNGNTFAISIYKNGAEFKTVFNMVQASASFNVYDHTMTIHIVDSANGSDYYEVYGYENSTIATPEVVGTAAYSFFMGSMA